MNFIERFRAALRIPTWWPAAALPGDKDAESVLLRFQEFLMEHYPAFHHAAQRWALNPYSVVYRWPGSNGQNISQDTLDDSGGAVLFLAHYDVVAAETEKWSVDPFGAEMRDGFIYGRGSLDMKSILISMMEAAENLCAAGFKPKQDIWFAFGGDEERTGIYGAIEAAKWFTARNQRFAWILDEGTPIGENHIKGVNTPLALISIEEKGFLSLDVRVTQEPGHASRPPRTQAAQTLGRALCRIAKHPFPRRLTPTVESFFAEVSSYMPGITGFVMRHARAFGPLFFAATGSNPAIDSMLRTTVAMTQLEGSAADNVLPSEVRAVLNLRLLPPWTVEKAIDFIRAAIHDKRARVSVHGLGTNPVAATDNFRHSGWPEIEAALKTAWPGIPPVPFIMTATTDSRHFQKLTGGIFRFNPHKLNPQDLGGIHGHDERISVENLEWGLHFYTALLGAL